MKAVEETLYEKNISLLKKNHPTVWHVLTMDNKEPSPGIEMLFSETGKPNLLVKGIQNETILIHNRENPGSESEAFLSMVKKDSTGVVLVFGMGLGYLALELSKQREKLQHILIFELNVEFFSLALTHMDLTPLLGDKRVILSIGEVENVAELLKPLKRAFMLEDIHTHKLLTCFQFNPAYEDLSSAVFNLVSGYNIDGATQSINGQTFVENRLKHLTSMHHDNMLEELSGKFQGIPSLIVAAGPSLDKNIREVKRAVGKAVIISVDTALPALLKQGIVPDFVTSIDYNAPTYEKIADTASDKRIQGINLICTSWVAATVSKTYPARTIFWAFGENALEHWINTSLDGTMSTGGAGTVAHLNFLSAKILGCDPVIFVGQDLAYSYSKEHASGVVFTGTEPMEKILEHAVWVKGVNESKVPTTRSLHGYRIIFEQWIKNSEGRVINATEGGAWIEGTEHMTLSQAIDLFCKNDVFMDIVSDRKRKEPSKAMASMLKKVEQAEEIVKKADRLAGSVLKEIENLKGKKRNITCLDALSPKLRKQIITLDAAYNKADKNRLWQIFDEMTMEGLRQDEREKNEIERLADIPEKYLEWLSRSVKRTDRVNAIRQNNLIFFKGKLKDLISFYAEEKKILDRIEGPGMRLSDVLSLAEIYFQNGDYTLLDHFLKKYTEEESAAIHYYRGVIALYRREYGKAEQYFKNALNLDRAYEEKITVKRREMADYYYNWARTVPFESLIGLENKSGLHLRLKGIKCFPGHDLLMDEFREIAKKDLDQVMQNIQQVGDSSFNKEILEAWVEFLVNENEIQQCIPEDVKIMFFRHYGKILLDEKNFSRALENYKSALSLLPDRPELYVALTDLCFSMEEFDAGLRYLKTAVSLDRNYAIYWSNMGDNLQVREDYQGAIIAYENYFAVLSEKIEVLKKIEECYLKMGDKEAADKVQNQFEILRLKSSGEYS